MFTPKLPIFNIKGKGKRMKLTLKLKLNKKTLKNLSKDNDILPQDMTPQIGGGLRDSSQCDCTDTVGGTTGSAGTEGTTY